MHREVGIYWRLQRIAYANTTLVESARTNVEVAGGILFAVIGFILPFMKALKKTSPLIIICAALALATSVQYCRASSTIIYTTEVTDKEAPKEARSVQGNSMVEPVSVKTAPAKPALPLFSVSLEPKGKATVSESYSSRVVTTYYADYTQSGSTVVLTFTPETAKHPVTLSRSGNRLSVTSWNSADWGRGGMPVMHRDSSDPQTAAASSGHHFLFF
jgi:hypothetical protein